MSTAVETLAKIVRMVGTAALPGIAYLAFARAVHARCLHASMAFETAPNQMSIVETGVSCVWMVGDVRSQGTVSAESAPMRYVRFRVVMTEC